MISTELLQRCPFFSRLNEAQRKAIAAITEDVSFEKDTILFEEGQEAEALYILLQGTVDLFLTGGKDLSKPLWVGQINPDEPFGISALIEPHILTASARVTAPTRVMKISGAALRALCELDPRLSAILIHQIAKAAMERLHFVQVQLAASQA
jgi:CRP-like cAMP-binding protein